MGGRYRYGVRSGGLVVGMLAMGLTLHGPPPDFVGHGLTDTLDEAKDRFRAA
jgi:hypothetical protein